MNNPYEQYAIIQSKIDALTEEKNKLRTAILEDMVAKKEKKVTTEIGSFTVSLLKKWTYPAYVTEMEEEYKAVKEKSVSTGEATFVEEPSLKFTGIKL